MKLIPLLIVILVLLSACSYKTATMVEPISGDVYICKPIGKEVWSPWTYENCVRHFQENGYKKAETLTPQERENLPGRTQEFLEKEEKSEDAEKS